MRRLKRLERLVGEHGIEAGAGAHGDVGARFTHEIGRGHRAAFEEREALRVPLGGSQRPGGGLEVIPRRGELAEGELQLSASGEAGVVAP